MGQTSGKAKVFRKGALPSKPRQALACTLCMNLSVSKAQGLKRLIDECRMTLSQE